MQDANILLNRNYVREIMEGQFRGRICDDYCRDKTEDNVNAILKRIVKKNQPILSAKLQREYEARQVK